MATTTPTDYLKLVLGGIIICGACAIMMPDLLKYLLGIWRLILMVAVILIAAGSFGILSTRSARAKLKAEQAKRQSEQIIEDTTEGRSEEEI